MEAKLDMVLEQVGRDKNIDKSVLISALEQAILTAAKRTFGMNREMEAKFNPETGSVDLFLIVNVVEEDDAIEGREITVTQASTAGLEAELGDELLFQVFYRADGADREAGHLPARARGRARQRVQRVQGSQGRDHLGQRPPLRARRARRRRRQ